MKFVRRSITELVAKSVVGLMRIAQSSYSWLNFWRPIRESFTGAWQRNVTIDPQSSILAFSAVFACVTGIASDIAKMRIKLCSNNDGIWEEILGESPFWPVLRKPNRYQTRIKFIEQWIVSKLLYGNAYILKERDNRGIVVAMYVLDANRVTPLVAEDGSVYYQLQIDHLSGIDEEKPAVPASEIIHDTMVCLFHPLIGVSPIFACGVSATMGNRIQSNSTNLFGNRSMPGGILTAPGQISDETAARLKAAFEANYSGENVGRIAVLGDGLKFEQMVMTAEAAQLIDQLRWTVEDVARAFHYPLYKLGGPMPPYSSNLEALNMAYYTDCLQSPIECIELLLDEGMGLKNGVMGTEFDLDNLMRMDTNALYESNNKMVSGGWGKIDEARFRANMGPVTGGNTPYMQQQNYSLAALAKRDAREDPFASTTPPPPQPTTPPPSPPEPQKGLTDEELEWLCRTELEKELELA